MRNVLNASSYACEFFGLSLSDVLSFFLLPLYILSFDLSLWDNPALMLPFSDDLSFGDVLIKIPPCKDLIDMIFHFLCYFSDIICIFIALVSIYSYHLYAISMFISNIISPYLL